MLSETLQSPESEKTELTWMPKIIQNIFSFQIRGDFFLIGLKELIAKRSLDWDSIDFLFFFQPGDLID